MEQFLHTYSKKLKGKNDQRRYSGISYFPDKLKFSNYKYHTITPEQKYRPDKIALELYGDQNAYWLLDIINDFTHGIIEYKPNKKIKYIPLERL